MRRSIHDAAMSKRDRVAVRLQQQLAGDDDAREVLGQRLRGEQRITEVGGQRAARGEHQVDPLAHAVGVGRELGPREAGEVAAHLVEHDVERALAHLLERERDLDLARCPRRSW